MKYCKLLQLLFSQSGSETRIDLAGADYLTDKDDISVNFFLYRCNRRRLLLGVLQLVLPSSLGSIECKKYNLLLMFEI